MKRTTPNDAEPVFGFKPISVTRYRCVKIGQRRARPTKADIEKLAEKIFKDSRRPLARIVGVSPRVRVLWAQATEETRRQWQWLARYILTHYERQKP